MEQLCHQARPSSLVGRSNTAAAIAVEVFVEEDVIPEMRVIRQFVMVAEHGTTAAPVFQEKPAQTPRQLIRHILYGHEPAGAGRAFDFEIVAVIVVEFLQRFDDEIIHWHPDGSAPVGVAAEQPRVGFGRLVRDGELCPVRPEFIRMI